jgi:hypothetical protein
VWWFYPLRLKTDRAAVAVAIRAASETATFEGHRGVIGIRDRIALNEAVRRSAASIAAAQNVPETIATGQPAAGLRTRSVLRLREVPAAVATMPGVNWRCACAGPMESGALK